MQFLQHNLSSSLSRDLSALLFDFFLFRRSAGIEDHFETEKLKDTPTDFSRIRCPLCRWQPKKSSRWFCGDFNSHYGCGTEWNTFDTRGRCPGCNYLWKWTDCLRCFRSSPHEAWYEENTN